MEKRSALPRVNMKQVVKFAEFVEGTPIGQPLNFYSFTGKDGAEIIARDTYPPLHAPWAIDFFFIVGIHNYGFWHGEKNYAGPLWGTLNGKKMKGSDLLWSLLLREFHRDQFSLSGVWLKFVTKKRWESIMSDDNGVVEILASNERWDLTRALGDWFSRHTPPADRGKGWINNVKCTWLRPAEEMLARLTHPLHGAPGYKEDPLKKKAILFLMALANRPERFLVPEQTFVWDPIVDYHLMRLALRLGLVTLPKDWVSENTERKFTSAEREAATRKAVFRAVEAIIERSGRSMAEIDNLMWSARRFCPEVEKPNCDACMLSNACAKKTDLFQPVIRTTAY